mgnify:FL=1
MCNNKKGDKMSVQRDIIFRQIGAKVAYYRTLRGISQEKLAERMNLHKSVLSRIERGKYHNDISLSTILDIAEKLQIDSALFLTFNDLERQLWWEPLEDLDTEEEEPISSKVQKLDTLVVSEKGKK